jgi:hypothetical protein
MEEDHYIHPNAGPVKNPNAILEAADGSNDTDMVINDNHDNPEMPPLVVDDDPEDNVEGLEEEIQEETSNVLAWLWPGFSWLWLNFSQARAKLLGLGLALAWPGLSHWLGTKTWPDFGFGLALAQAIACTLKCRK